jgi:hypothetical protein
LTRKDALKASKTTDLHETCRIGFIES